MKKFIKSLFTLFVICLISVGIKSYSYCETLNFVQLSDIHYTRTAKDTTFKLLSHSKEIFEDVIQIINNTLPKQDFIMITGDLTDSSKESAVEEILPMVNSLNYPWYMGFGNHDISIGGTLNKEKYLSILRENNKNFVFEKPYYSFEPKNTYKVIVLDPIITDKITSTGTIYEEEMKWLKEELDKSQDKVVLIFMHHPVKEPFKSPGHRLTNAEELENLLNSYKMPIAVFTGHYHTTKIRQNNNIIYVASPALVTYPNAFRTVTIKNYRYKTIFDIDFIQTTRSDLVKLAKTNILGASIYEGDVSDKKSVFIINKND